MKLGDDEARVRAALSGLTAALAADKYALRVQAYRDRQLRISITAQPGSCPECLIPRKMMAELIRTQLPSDILTDSIEIRMRPARPPATRH